MLTIKTEPNNVSK